MDKGSERGILSSGRTEAGSGFAGQSRREISGLKKPRLAGGQDICDDRASRL